MELILNRDSVAAGDDMDSHERRFTAPDFMTPRQLFQLAETVRYLPTIAGGKATWSVWAGRGPLAILAQEWDEPKFIAPADKSLDADPLRVHFSYHAQKPPMGVYTEVMQGGHQPAKPRRPSLVSGDEFIAKFLAETPLGREHLMRPGLELARAIRNEALGLCYDKRTEASTDIPELFFAATKIALLVLDEDSVERQRHDRDLVVYLQNYSPRNLVLDFERFKKALPQ
jgi:hypothetical protein